MFWPISLIFASLFSAAACGAAEVTDLCNIHIEGAEKITFSNTEEKWLCGDSGTEAWKEIPVPQQKGWLSSFLQNRGYHNAVIADAEGRIQVNAGRRSIVERFTVKGAPPGWNWAKHRKVIGSVLDPNRLDDSATWAKRALQYRGYPCPKVEAQAFVDNNELLLNVDPGPKQQFGTVQAQVGADMDARILERFTAFAAGQDFDLRLLELTSDRILREDLYLSTFYDVMCDDNQHAQIMRRFVPAKPRLLTFGAGFDTEQGPIGRARWKRTMLTKKADSFESMANASFREQQIEMKYRNHFPEDPGSRLEFAPTILVDRRSEREFESISYQFEPALAHSFEHQSSETTARFGPMFKRTESIRPELSRIDNLRLRAQGGFTSKMFEYYSNDPREGWRIEAEAWTQRAGVLAERTIHKFSLKQEFLWNLGQFDPPLFVLGWRGYEGSFFAPGSAAVGVKTLPQSERFFLGGDEDIRGFGRQKLRGAGVGFLTAIYQGIELRVVKWLPLNLEPFFFFDAAKGGVDSAHLDSPIYYSPGLGLRWASPVGTLRASLARGFASQPTPSDPMPNLQFFLSFGKEF